MKITKKITLSAMAVALSAVFLVIGAFVSVADLLLGVVASLLMVFIFIEVGSPYTYFVWLGTTLAVFFLPSGMTVAVLYLFVFGLYPILKAYIERAPRFLWWPLRLVYANAVITVLLLLTELVLGTPFFETELWYLKVGIWLLMNAAFVAYDMFLTAIIRLYINKYRKYFKNLLK